MLKNGIYIYIIIRVDYSTKYGLGYLYNNS